MARPLSCRLFCASVAVLLSSASAVAAPVKINGAELELPGACRQAEGAIVCNVDGQQLEVWISKTALGGNLQVTDTFMRRLTRFNEIHSSAVSSITRSTGNDKVASFDSYAGYSALGALISSSASGKPVVRFASIMHDGEVWQILEAVAQRTPAVEALSSELQRSFKLPAVEPVAAQSGSAGDAGARPAAPGTAAAAPVPPPPPEPPATTTPLVATLFSAQYPIYLQADVVENAVDSVLVNLRRRSHAGGPNVSITVRNIRDATTPAALMAAQRSASNANMAGPAQTVDINSFGALNGVGYAMIGTPDTKKGLSGVESVESYFVTEVNGRRLEVRMTAERAYAADAQATWALLGSTLKLIN